MIISFAHTTPALLAGRKTVTRRAWAPRHARTFTAGLVVDAWDQLPRVRGSRRVARTRLTHDAYEEPVALMPDSDYEAEGFAYLADALPPWEWAIDYSRDGFDRWRASGAILWVVRFTLLEVLP